MLQGQWLTMCFTACRSPEVADRACECLGFVAACATTSEYADAFCSGFKFSQLEMSKCRHWILATLSIAITWALIPIINYRGCAFGPAASFQVRADRQARRLELVWGYLPDDGGGECEA